MTHELAVLRRNGEKVGREESGIRKTMLSSGDALLGGDVAGFVAEMRPYAEPGVEMVMAMPPGDGPARWWAPPGTRCPA